MSSRRTTVHLTPSSSSASTKTGLPSFDRSACCTATLSCCGAPIVSAARSRSASVSGGGVGGGGGGVGGGGAPLVGGGVSSAASIWMRGSATSAAGWLAPCLRGTWEEARRGARRGVMPVGLRRLLPSVAAIEWARCIPPPALGGACGRSRLDRAVARVSG